jgi:RHS repeat-associated protein
VVNGAGVPINIEYNPEESIQIVRDVYGNPTTYRYDDRGNVLEVKNALGFSTFFEYDANNNLTQTRDANNLVTKYEYDTRGNLTSKTEAYCGCAGVVPGTTYYTYDARGQMQDLVLPTGTSMHLSYDAHGNMLSMTDGKGGVIQSFTYYDNGLVKTETDTAGTTTYEYNNFGDVIKTIDNQQTTYTWNDENRLVAVQTADGKAIGYTYNTDGIRVSSTVDGATTQYLVDSNRDYAQVLEEYVDGVRSVSYVYGRDLIAQERSSLTSFYLVDGLGSTTALTDARGNVTDTYSYEAFGELEGRSGSTENQYLFAGEQFDENVDTYYLRDRYYDSSVGRFTKRDSYEGKQNQPLTLHKYVYVHDNPINLVDPTGWFSIAEINAVNSIRGTLTEIYSNMLSDFIHSVPEAEGIASVFDFANNAQAIITVAPAMVGAIWTSTSKLSAVQNAFNHWKKHRADFPQLSNAKSFVEFGQQFIDNPPSTALKKIRSNGDIVIYDPASDLFAVATSSGTPRTIYKPDPSIHGLPTNLDYYHAQK